MQNSKVYDPPNGGKLTVICYTYPQTIDIYMTLDTSELDAELPAHSGNELAMYLELPGVWERPGGYWWYKRDRRITVRTASQARRVIRRALLVTDEAVAQALVARRSRELEVAGVLP